MSEEERKAVEFLIKRNEYMGSYRTDLEQNIDIVLNLIEKQSKEIELKDKVIEEMAETLEKAKLCYFKKEDGGEFLGKYRCYNKEDWKKYFINKVKEKK